MPTETIPIIRSDKTAFTAGYILAAAGAVFITWLLHEFAHWAVSEWWFGYETVLTLNSAYPVAGKHEEAWHSIVISAAGPLITLGQAVVVFGLLKQKWNKVLYLFLFIPFYMRLLAGLMNVINLNDEGRISSYLNLGTFTMPLIISAGLFLMVYRISKKYKLDWKFQTITIGFVMLASSVLILADQFFGIRIL